MKTPTLLLIEDEPALAAADPSRLGQGSGAGVAFQPPRKVRQYTQLYYLPAAGGVSKPPAAVRMRSDDALASRTTFSTS